MRLQPEWGCTEDWEIKLLDGKFHLRFGLRITVRPVQVSWCVAPDASKD